MTIKVKEASTVSYNPFLGNPIEKVVPLTEAQQEIWVSCIIGSDEANIAYNESISLGFTGRLNIDAMKRAIHNIILRHESLRASFSTDGTKMIIYEYINDYFSYQDISHEPKEDQIRTIQSYTDNAATTPFNLADGPLIYFSLFKKNENESILHINAHHIVCDGWSFGVLLEDLCALYNNITAGKLFPAIPDQFSNYAIDDYSYAQTEEYEQTETYWLRQYKNNVPHFELPVDFERSSLRTFACHRNDFVIDRSLSDEIKKIAASHNISFVTTLMAVFEILLYKVTDKNDIVLGIPTSGQAASGMFNLIGHCVNLLPVRTVIQNNYSLIEYLKKRKKELLDDYDHQRYTFGSLLKKIELHRDSSRIPLVPVSFNIDIGMDMHVSFNELKYKIIYNARKSETFELFLNITETNNNYVFQWTYNTNLFRKETIKEWMDAYKFLLEQIILDEQIKINDLKTFNEKSFEDSFVKKIDTYRQLPEATTIEIFESNVSQYATNTAIEFNSEKINYAQLNELANKLARYLISKGLQPGGIAAITLERSIWLPVTILAVMKCGATYLPLDPEFPQNRISFMLHDCAAYCNVINKKYSGKYSSDTKEIIVEDILEELHSIPNTNIAETVSQQSLAYIIYTSGSTGKPKGVKITHRNLLNFLLSMKRLFQTNSLTRLLAITTISFDIAGLEMFLPLISGGTIVLADEQTTRNGEMLVRKIFDREINIIQATPSTYKMMLNVNTNKKIPVTALCGGEALPKALANSLLARVEHLYNMYGPTETTIWSTVAKITKTDLQITIGSPIDNTQIYILNDKGQLLPDGTVGEICIGGEGVAAGYYNRDDLTREKFIPNNIQLFDGAFIYKTGDLGHYLPDGKILCLGRNDQQTKIRGYRIELGDIEHHLIKLNGIKDAVCIVKENHNNEHLLVAYIVLKETGTELSKKQLIEWRTTLKSMLPQYMIPEEFIALNEFPLTPNKKVDRVKLSQVSADFIANNNLVKQGTNATINIIKDIWGQELNIPDIDENDDFFELGGHSMTAIKVMSRLEKETGHKLPISVLFENSTAKNLAELIKNNKQTNNNKVLVPIKQDGNKTPVFFVHAGGLNALIYKSLGQFFDDNRPIYGIQGLGLDGNLTDLQNMEVMAARYLKEVLEYYNNGPLILIGYSFGGIIAYEMARQAMQLGKEIKMLGVLDSYAKPSSENNILSKYYTKSIRQFKKLAFFGNRFIKNPSETVKYQKLVLLRKFNKNFVEAEDDQIYDYDNDVVMAYENIYNNYVMRPMDITIHLFKVQKRVYYLDDPKFLGWKEFAKQGVKVFSIPGDHKTFLNPPNNKILAEILQNVIDSNK
ncbi:MAG: non-ribosomal peptide synthetase [Niabella sp.]